jgi:excinuclease ABC subunit A
MESIGIDEDLVIPNKSLSVYQDAVACWRAKNDEWKMNWFSRKIQLPNYKPFYELRCSKIFGLDRQQAGLNQL